MQLIVEKIENLKEKKFDLDEIYKIYNLKLKKIQEYNEIKVLYVLSYNIL